MEQDKLEELAMEAYHAVFNQSEDRVVNEAITKFSDPDDRADYVESYQDIFQKGWANYIGFRGAFKALLSPDEEIMSNSDMEIKLSGKFQIAQVTNPKIGTTHKYIRPIAGHENEPIEEDSTPSPILPELDSEQKSKILSAIIKIVKSKNSDRISMVLLAPKLKNEYGIDYKVLGYSKLREMLSMMDDVISLQNISGTGVIVKVLGLENSPELEKKETEGTKLDNSDVIDKVKDALIKAYKKHPELGDNWVNSIYIAPELASNGINYKELGFPKLKQFLVSMSKDIELNQVSATELHVRVKINSIQKERYSPFEKLTRFAFFPHKDQINGFTLMLNELERKALKEPWQYGEQKILQNFLLYSFERICDEDERNKAAGKEDCLKLFEGKNHSVFNTGLVNSYYSPLYALFNKNTTGKQKWIFSGFQVETDKGLSKVKKEENWDNLPRSARFYDSPDDLIYDIESKIDAINWEHIIIDNVDRIPVRFIEKYCPLGFVLEKMPEHPNDYYNRLRESIREDQFTQRKLVEIFENAMKRAIVHVTWNFHYALPMYYPRGKRVDMLLPLALEDSRNNNEIDLVLVLDRDKAHHSYTATTIMTLEQVYCNVRLISQIEEDCQWLKAKQVKSAVNE